MEKTDKEEMLERFESTRNQVLSGGVGSFVTVLFNSDGSTNTVIHAGSFQIATAAALLQARFNKAWAAASQVEDT